MSLLRTYDRNILFRSDNVMTWPIVPLRNDGDEWVVDDRPGLPPMCPGDWVAHRHDGGRGIIVAINDEQASVVWSLLPEERDLSKFAFPIVRTTFPQLRAQQLVSVQPMTAPAGAIFYMDYKYGKADETQPAPAQPAGPSLPRPGHRAPRRPGRPTRGPRKNP